MSVQLVDFPQVTVATAGAEQRLISAPEDKIVKLYITAMASNTGNIFIGGSTVSTTRGIKLVPGGRVEIYNGGEFVDAYNIYVDSASNGDKVNVAALKRA